VGAAAEQSPAATVQAERAAASPAPTRHSGIRLGAAWGARRIAGEQGYPWGGSFGLGGTAQGGDGGGGGGGWQGGAGWAGGLCGNDGGGGGGSGYVSHFAHHPAFPGGISGGDGKVIVSTP
jgi:hypothetical protein